MCKLLLTILLPPLGVYVMTKKCKKAGINLLLTLLFYIPGLVHGLYIYFKNVTTKETTWW